MDLRLLEAFRAVVDHRSVTNAAAVLGVTQPAVSAQIARLEQELGFSLFDRGDRATEADTRGRSLLCRSEQGADWHRSTYAGSRAHPHRPDRPAHHSQPPERGDFAAARPGLDVSRGAAGRARTAAVAQLRRHQPAAANGELRYWHRRAADRRDGSEVDPLSHALRGDPADEARAERTQGADTRIAVGTSRRCPGAHLADVLAGSEGLRGRGSRVEPVAEAEYFASVCGLVASGVGWSIVDPLSARTFEHLGVAIRAFEPAIHYEIGAFCARESEPSILAQSFLSMLSDRLDALDD